MNRKNVVWARLLLLGMPILAYLPTWQNQLIDYDDEQLITNNVRVTEGLSWENICWAWTHHEGPYWMPVTWMSFQFDALFSPGALPEPSHLSQLSAAAFHGQNLFWHCCNIQLLFALLLHLTGLPGRAFLVSALFAIHPMQVESVAWAIERKDVLMCFFALLSIWAYVRHVEKPGVLIYLAMLLSYELSLACKPMLITFPFLLLLLDYWPLYRWDARFNRFADKVPVTSRWPAPGWLFIEKLPVFSIAVIMSFATMATRTGNSMPELTALDKVMNALTGYECYLRATFYPVGLAIFYPHPVHEWSLVDSFIGLGLVVGGSTFALWQRERRRWFAVGWFWFLGTLVPVIGLTQGGHQAWADRFCYWPHIGLFIAIVWSFAEIAGSFRAPNWFTSLGWSALLACFMLLTWIQLGFWRSSVEVWKHAVDVTRDNALAHEHLSLAYRRLGNFAESEYYAREAVRIQKEKRMREQKKNR